MELTFMQAVSLSQLVNCMIILMHYLINEKKRDCEIMRHYLVIGLMTGFSGIAGTIISAVVQVLDRPECRTYLCIGVTN